MSQINDRKAMGSINDVTNLYGEDGIQIGLTDDYDICDPSDEDCTAIVVGHELYASSIDEAHKSIRAEYLRRKGINPEF